MGLKTIVIVQSQIDKCYFFLIGFLIYLVTANTKYCTKAITRYMTDLRRNYNDFAIGICKFFRTINDFIDVDK